MTIPALLLGVLIATFVGALFHLWKDGGPGRLLLYIVLSWVGFWLGHVVGLLMDWSFWGVGALRLGTALFGCVFVLFLGYWLSLVQVDRKE